MEPSDIAIGIGLPLDYIIRLASRADRLYTTYYKKKNKTGKTREINAPNQELKGIQTWILTQVLEPHPVSVNAFAYVKGKSIRDNAQIHLGRPFVACIDIKDFFPSINYFEVLKIFKRLVRKDEAAKILTQLCTYEGHLPQGAVTSPYLSNLIFSPIDDEIRQHLSKSRIAYSRYADDLVFSSHVLARLENAVEAAETILKKHGFALNDKKKRFMSGKKAIRINGLNINNRQISIGRDRKRLLRAQLHRLHMGKKATVNERQAYGMLSFLRSIEPQTYANFKKYLAKLQTT